MLQYAQLLECAKALPRSLIQPPSKSTHLNGIWGLFFQSPLVSDAYEDTLLVEKLATCLKDMPNNLKIEPYAVLVGIYIYLLKKHEIYLQDLNSKSLSSLLRSQLEVNSSKELDCDLVYKSIEELKRFCSWVFVNQKENKDLHQLYTMFANDIQASLLEIQFQARNMVKPDSKCGAPCFN